MWLLFGARDALFLNDYYDKPHVRRESIIKLLSPINLKD
jgi:hypothetical protein